MKNGADDLATTRQELAAAVGARDELSKDVRRLTNKLQSKISELELCSQAKVRTVLIG